mmetsp:Transcript_14897/g.42995  ORF Transcript_14897/g.42995 Transcript_14897/m.42995 type:complete len:306 (-) Transcript_14897:999-1916(-)
MVQVGHNFRILVVVHQLLLVRHKVAQTHGVAGHERLRSGRGSGSTVIGYMLTPGTLHCTAAGIGTGTGRSSPLFLLGYAIHLPPHPQPLLQHLLLEGAQPLLPRSEALPALGHERTTPTPLRRSATAVGKPGLGALVLQRKSTGTTISTSHEGEVDHVGGVGIVGPVRFEGLEGGGQPWIGRDLLGLLVPLLWLLLFLGLVICGSLSFGSGLLLLCLICRRSLFLALALALALCLARRLAIGSIMGLLLRLLLSLSWHIVGWSRWCRHHHHRGLCSSSGSRFRFGSSRLPPSLHLVGRCRCRRRC